MMRDQLRELVAEASVAPSVHNVQPARWRIDGDALVLLEDMSRRLTIGDPTGNDAGLSLGAAAEGLAIAASTRGLQTYIRRCAENGGELRQIARVEFSEDGIRDSLAHQLSKRASWRGGFVAPTSEMVSAATALAKPDCLVVTDREEVDRLARWYDQASFTFMRKHGFRGELRRWMRLSRSHPDWARDGLNADAMKLSKVEALGAGAVLGVLFRPLAWLGLARPLLAEAKSFGNAVGVALLHRPKEELPFESGRRFHRLWLEIEEAGFGANVLAALADESTLSRRICEQYGIDADRRLVTAFRFGARVGNGFAPARLPLNELLVD